MLKILMETHHCKEIRFKFFYVFDDANYYLFIIFLDTWLVKKGVYKKLAY